ncbi:MAG TPA: hypothetical protein VJK52_02665 [Candidatus Nanoarchaeia archaeon]|nr:hypothetical protein [Candidatus Nanoarchaeia archaeon]
MPASNVMPVPQTLIVLPIPAAQTARCRAVETVQSIAVSSVMMAPSTAIRPEPAEQAADSPSVATASSITAKGSVVTTETL